MQRDHGYLFDILEAAKLAISYAEGVAKDAFLLDRQCQDSVIRRIEIIGEASRRVSLQTRAAFPAIPRSEMVGMRHLKMHDYDDVDLEIEWDTVQCYRPA